VLPSEQPQHRYVEDHRFKRAPKSDQAVAVQEGVVLRRLGLSSRNED
jgi:hypothetical protein